MKKKLLSIGLIGIMMVGATGCTTVQKAVKDLESETKGIHRIVKVYADNGTLIEQYESEKMLVTDGSGGTITIDFEGKRVVFCNVDLVIEEVK